jgi:hypothetical protein
MSPAFRRCEDCGGERLFEQPHETGSCPDSPDGRCPEWACTDCGTAVPALLLPPQRSAVPAPALRARSAPAPTPAVAGRVA